MLALALPLEVGASSTPLPPACSRFAFLKVTAGFPTWSSLVAVLNRSGVVPKLQGFAHLSSTKLPGWQVPTSSLGGLGGFSQHFQRTIRRHTQKGPKTQGVRPSTF